MTQAPATAVSQSWAIQARGLAKAYGYQWALRGIDLELRLGSSLAVFGPNGSGKTTLIKLLATLARPTAGTALIAGHDVVRDALAVRRLVGVVGHEPWLYEELSAHENLAFYGRMYRVPDVDRRSGEVLRMMGLETYGALQVRALSHGLRRRLALARALLHRPQVLLLDEPAAGLDPAAVDLLGRALAQERAAGVSVVVTTHDLDWGLSQADRALVLNQGRVVYDSTGARPDVAAIAACLHREAGDMS